LAASTGSPVAAAELTMSTLSGAFELRVPLAVNLASGQSWADAKS
jgi:DNA polymerase I-like protein with 3'-5' exonuclease and polymerase domains